MPGLVTETCTVPAVAIAVAGIVAVSWFPVTYLVVCCAPFQFTTALLAKPLPLTVKVNPGPPDVAVSGESCVTAGTIPACGAGALGELYPQPKQRIVRQRTDIVFMIFSRRASRFGGISKRQSGECQATVTFLLRKCLGAVGQWPGFASRVCELTWGTFRAETQCYCSGTCRFLAALACGSGRLGMTRGKEAGEIRRRGTPLPLILQNIWNHRVSEILPAKSRCQRAYRQNLES